MGGYYASAEVQSVYSTAPDNWAIFLGGVMTLHGIQYEYSKPRWQCGLTPSVAFLELIAV